uniref:Uncharacterized protein n=1 Tax=Chenopodium quinoa TaxID=63459 RepID=A0A803LCM9_CHEQI
MGHGMKDCEEYRDAEKPVTSYGAWMKASPWKYTSSVSDEGGGSDRMAGAKVLFVTKSKKKPPSSDDIDRVLDMADKLNVVGLDNDINIGDKGLMEESSKGVSTEVLDYESGAGKAMNREVSSGTEEAMKGDGKAGKGWKRVSRDMDHSMSTGVVVLGEKRSLDNSMEESEAVMTVSIEKEKRRRVQVPNAVKVASPTNRALGEGRRRRGGLALLWNNSIDVNIRSFSLNHIDARVRSITQDEWRFSGIYGHPDEENKYKIGQLLISLKGGTDTPWLCGGDLILMLHSGEKQGGRVFDMEEAEILRDVVGVCELEDLGFIGHDFTWSNNRGGEESIQERLDRFLANRTWRDAFQGSFVTHLTKRKSDHLPILLCVQDVVSKQKKKKKKKLYRVEAWDYGGDLCSKIAFTSTRLSAWSRDKFGDFIEKLKACKAQMKVLMGEAQTVEVIAQRRALDDRMDELERREEMYWKQRSRQDWLKHGDKNNSFTKKPSKEKRGIISDVCKMRPGTLIRRRNKFQKFLLIFLKTCSL